MIRSVLLAATLFAAACSKPPPPAPPPAVVDSSSSTRWIRPGGATDVALLEAPARVLASPQASAAVSAPLPARVVAVKVAAGQRVQKGEALIEVLMPELVRAAGAYTAATLKLDAYTRRRAQLESLKQEGLVRLTEIAELDAELATSRADAQAARATLRAAGVGDQRAQQLLNSDGTIELTAPISGVIVSVDAMPGSVREATGAPLLQIAGDGEVRVEARLPGDLLDGARFEFVSGQGQRVSLEALSFSPRLEERDGARLAWFRVPAGVTVPTAGTSGRVRVLAADSWRTVPRRAVRTDAGQASVMVRSGEAPAELQVKVVASSGAEAVVAGIPTGAEVAADVAAFGGAVEPR